MPAASISSGLRYFQAFDNAGNRTHYVWPEPPGCPKFETPGTPLQLIQNVAILHASVLQNGGVTGSTTVDPNDPYYLGIMNAMLTVLQQMNAAITMTDLTNVLNNPTYDTQQAYLDLGQTVYLIYDPTQTANDGLEMVTNLPNGITYQPVDSTEPAAGLQAFYGIANYSLSGGDRKQSFANTLIDSAAAPNSTITYNGQTVYPAPYGDNEVPVVPSAPMYPTYPPYINPLGSNNMDYAADVAAWYAGSGANNNHGELHFFESLFPMLTGQ
jgi:hypothetical protein